MGWWRWNRRPPPLHDGSRQEKQHRDVIEHEGAATGEAPEARIIDLMEVLKQSLSKGAQKDAAKLEPQARDALRAERQKQWDEIVKREFDPGRENCVKECRRSAKPEDIECVDGAKTLAAAKDCLK